MNKLSKGLLSQSVCENIKILRLHYRWSQRYVASQLGISTSAFSNIENGFTDINLSRLEQIARVLKVRLVELVAIYDPYAEDKNEASNTLYKTLADRNVEVEELQFKIYKLREELKGKKQQAVINVGI
ncbi:Helix-turn-helix [Mucilaginibacter mallensis]|uniref:Helix-turn-helix n=1 Tax=Mucilaginibacter mallensis TaxID=652787 RepID=A0A1H1XZZ4_MUCMA|nr:helix-turn-helix transcriptional regulator [Mucilaginibacter mallensis]SDT14804.1 Helix-turn-helix [Mucilaginibacter mallensis]